MGLDRGELVPAKAPCLHLYQDLSPVKKMNMSKLATVEFYESVTTNPPKFIRFPGLIFV